MTAFTVPQQSLRRDAWIIGLIGVAHATSHFFQLILAPLFPWLKDAFGLSYAQLGMLMTVFFAVSAVSQALSGFIVDRVGPLPVHLIGLSVLCLSALGLAVSQSYGMLLFFEAVARLGNSIFHPSGFAMLNHRVSVGRLGHAFSVHGVSGNLGWAAAPIFLVTVATLASWRIALVGAAVLAFIVLILIFSFRHLLETRTVPHSDDCSGYAPRSPLELISLVGLISLKGVWMCFAFFLITAMSNGGIQSFAPSALCQIYGVPITMASASITAYMLSSACGMICGGFLAARTTRHERVIAFSFASSGLISVFVAGGIVPGPVTVLLLALIGFGAGIAGPSRDLMVRAAAPRHATGRVYGLVYSGLDIGLSLSPLLFGAMMDAHRPARVFIMIGVFQCMAIFTALGIGERTARLRMQSA